MKQYLNGDEFKDLEKSGEFKDLEKSFDSFNENPGKKLIKNYLNTVFLVYLVIVCVLICLLFFPSLFLKHA